MEGQSTEQEQYCEQIYDSMEVAALHTEQRTKALFLVEIFPENKCSGKQCLHAKVDSGAEGNILPLRTFKKIFPHLVGSNHTYTRLTAYNGTEITCYRKVNIQSLFRSVECNASFYVVDSPGPPIIGLPTCERLQIIQMNCSVENHTGEQLNSKGDLKKLYR